MSEQLNQYTEATTNVALFHLGKRAQIELRGADRLSFLHNFCTNDITKLLPGEGCEAFLTNIKGRILGHIIVSATDDTLCIDSEPNTAAFIVSHLDKYVITEDVQITDRSSDFDTFLLVGPNANSWLTSQIGSFAGPKTCGQVATSFAGIEITLRCVPFTAQPSIEVISASADSSRLWQMLIDAGVKPAGLDVLEALRIEASYPRYGIDLTDANIAQEANRTEQTISFTKGCYLGQEPIARLDALGHVNKDLRRLRLADGFVPTADTPVNTINGDEVGRTTSATLSPKTGHSIALAMLKTTASSSGIELIVGTTPAAILTDAEN